MTSNELESPISHDDDINSPLHQQVINEDIVSSPHRTREPVRSNVLTVTWDNDINSPLQQQVIKEIISVHLTLQKDLCALMN